MDKFRQYSYSVAIRTLGTAGEKYRQTLQSAASQTIQPEHIFVYIPYGYALPKETIGREEIKSKRILRCYICFIEKSVISQVQF